MASLHDKIVSSLIAKDWDAVLASLKNGELNINDCLHNQMGTPFTLIGCAVEMKRQDIVESLATSGADINKITANRTPLMWACALRQRETVELLIKVGADVNIRTKKIPGEDHGETALMLAAEQGQIDIVKRLLAVNADVTCMSAKGRTALTAASDAGSKELLTLLVDAGCPLTGVELHNPIFRRDLDLVKYLINCGSDVNAPYPNSDMPGIFRGDTPLLVAVRRNNKELVAAIGINPPVNPNERISIINELIAKGATVNVFGSKKFPPLAEAVINQDKEVVKILLAAGADPNFGHWKAGSGKTILEIAKSKKSQEIVKLLTSAASQN